MVKLLVDLLKETHSGNQIETQVEDSPEHNGDLALLNGIFDKAINYYMTVDDGGIRIAEKQAWCWYQLGEREKLVTLLSPFPEEELSPMAKTLLAIGLINAWPKKYESVSNEARQHAKALLDQVIAVSTDVILAYRARCDLWFNDNDESVKAKLAFRMVTINPHMHHFRRRVAELRQFLPMSDQDALVYLRVGLDYETIVDDIYLWRTANLAEKVHEYEFSLNCLRMLESRTVTSGLDEDHRNDLVAVIENAKAEVRYAQGMEHEAITVWKGLSCRPWQTANFPDELAIHAHFHLIDAAARSNSVVAIAQAVSNLLSYLKATPETILDLAGAYLGSIGPFYLPDGQRFLLDPIHLRQYEDLITKAMVGKELGLMLWFLAQREDISDENEPEQQIKRLERAASLLQHPALDGALVENVYLKQKPIPWRLIGEAWTRSSLYSITQGGSDAYRGCPLDWVDKITKKSVTDYAAGVVNVMAPE